MYKAFIFDLDGTLVDSSRAIGAAMTAWCQRHGLDLERALQVCQGTRTEDFVAEFAPHLCVEQEVKHIEALESEYLDFVEPLAGAEAFVHSLAGDQWGIATSGPYDIAYPRLLKGRLPVPRVLVTAEMVSRGKPHPEPYLLASEQLGVDTQEVLVFEDSDAGIESALSAGCHVVAVGHAHTVSRHSLVANITDYASLSVQNAERLILNGLSE